MKEFEDKQSVVEGAKDFVAGLVLVWSGAKIEVTEEIAERRGA
jgi:hypothetical protein